MNEQAKGATRLSTLRYSNIKYSCVHSDMHLEHYCEGLQVVRKQRIV